MSSHNLSEMDLSGDYFQPDQGNEKKRKLNDRDNNDDSNSENTIHTNNFETLLNNNVNDIYHIVISKSYRTQIVLDLKFLTPLSDDKLISTVSNNLQESDESVLFYIAGFDKVESRVEKDNNLNDVYYEKCLFVIFCIPKQLIGKMIENNIYKSYFYIGNYDEKQKFLIMNKEPEYDKLSDKSEIGVNLPFQTTLLTFEKQ